MPLTCQKRPHRPNYHYELGVFRGCRIIRLEHLASESHLLLQEYPAAADRDAAGHGGTTMSQHSADVFCLQDSCIRPTSYDCYILQKFSIQPTPLVCIILALSRRLQPDEPSIQPDSCRHNTSSECCVVFQIIQKYCIKKTSSECCCIFIILLDSCRQNTFKAVVALSADKIHRLNAVVAFSICRQNTLDECSSSVFCLQTEYVGWMLCLTANFLRAYWDRWGQAAPLVHAL